MSSHLNNILFTHSGGVTSVVNTVAANIALLAKHDHKHLYVPRFGVDGILSGDYQRYDTLSESQWHQIAYTPGSSFGSSRTRLPEHIDDYQLIFQQFETLSIGTFFCNGGNNSQLITLKMQEAADHLGYPLKCIGIPKTIDNDIFETDTCPGYGSCAKYTATSVYEMSLDLAAMCQSSTKVLIYEAMGRDTGWIAAASALAKSHPQSGPHIILLPEAQFSLKDLLSKVRSTIKQYNHCVICIAEGASDIDGILLKKRTHYPYISLYLNEMISGQLDVKTHVVIPDYLQRSARHLASETDVAQTTELAKHAYKLAINGKKGIMTTVKRNQTEPYSWSIDSVELTRIAGKTRTLPNEFVSDDQLFVTDACIQYIKPLILGEVYPPYHLGLPEYSNMIYNNHKVNNKDNI